MDFNRDLGKRLVIFEVTLCETGPERNFSASVKCLPRHIKRFFKALSSFSFHFLPLKGRNIIVFAIFILVLKIILIINLSIQIFCYFLITFFKIQVS